jgi:uncharacterized protein involved in exopolysaccharide biosynthesis
MDNLKKDISNQKDVAWEKQLQSLFDRLLPYLLRIWNQRNKWILINGIGLLVILLYLLFLAKPYYDATIYVLPDYGNKANSLASLSSLASVAGLSAGLAVPTEIYANIITSESVLMPVLMHKYLTKEYKDSVDLIDYFNIRPDDDLLPVERERKRFLKVLKIFKKECMKTNVDKETTILEINVRMPESKLAAEVANRIAESLDSYVRTQRKSNAFNQRIYLEKRVKEVSDSLASAEEELRSFKEKNIASGATPRLFLQGSRLSRNVDLFQSVYLDLTRQSELVKLDEIKDAPVINVQELSDDPIIKTGPKRTLWLIFLMTFYFILSTLFITFKPELKRGCAIITNLRKYFK